MPPHHLSARKLRLCDRMGGAYLVIDWPETLPRPADLVRDDLYPASQAQHVAAMRAVADLVARHGLIHIATSIGIVQATIKRPYELKLLAQLVTSRWAAKSERGAVRPLLWPADALGQDDGR